MIRRAVAVASIPVASMLVAACGGEPQDMVWATIEGLGRSLCEEAGSCTNTCPEGQTYNGRSNTCRPAR